MKKLNILFLFFVQLVFAQVPINYKSTHNLIFDSIPALWDEAMPLGNGMLGSLVWNKNEKLRLAIDRADLWDLRPMKEFESKDFSFKFLFENYKNQNYPPIEKLIDEPYEKNIAPTRIPGAAIEFKLKNIRDIKVIYVSYDSAFAYIEWKNGLKFKSFIHANKPVGWFRFDNLKDEIIPELIVPDYAPLKVDKNSDVSSLNTQDVKNLNYSKPELRKELSSIIYHQKGYNGFSYDIKVSWKKINQNTLVGAWTIISEGGIYSNEKDADKIIKNALSSGFEIEFKTHIQWWKKYWDKSAISLPDKKLEGQWYSEIYKFGSSSRKGAPPISLQAVWTADNGKLPPWKGDYHNDLNTQLSYWPTYSSNHLEEGYAFIEWLLKIKNNCRKFTEKYFKKDGLNVPGVCTITGDPLGGWGQYSLSLTTAAWLSQHFYLHYNYSKDKKFLKEIAYPWIKESLTFINEISEMDIHRKKRKLPLSSSPEINDNKLEAWFPDNTNYDLALIHWLYKAAIELAGDLKLNSEKECWEKIYKEWPDFAYSDRNGLLVAPGYPLPFSHRHFSHLMAIYPLGLLDIGIEGDKKNIELSLNELSRLGTDYWVGYSFSWLGNLYARAQNGNKAFEALKTFSDCFCSKNSFHLNGDQSNTGKSKFTYRPFTLEGNFAFATGIQEMLLQSQSGLIRIFPAIPDEWKDVSFKTLRAEGAFLVSSVMKNGKVTEVKIFSEKRGEMKFLNPFKDSEYKINGKISKLKKHIISLNMKEGESLTFSL